MAEARRRGVTLPGGFVDLHAHVLPALDDGPADLATAVTLLRVAVAGGTAAIVATTHSAEVLQGGLDRPALEERLSEVRRAAIDAGLPIKVYIGTEIYLEPDSAERLRQGQLITINGSRYVLVEPPFQDLPLYLAQAFFDLQTAGYIPLVAHPERNAVVQREPERLAEWVQRGALIQVSAASITGGFGRAAARVARQAIAHQLCHVIASDGHDPIHRSPDLRAAYGLVTDEFGAAMAQALFVDGPAALLRDATPTWPEPLPFEPERAAKGIRRWFGRG